MQLVAYGAQDIYLTGNPQITFFKIVYRRHTNYAIESIEQTFNGTVRFGNKTSCTISRNGDLITDCWLEVSLKKTGDTFYPGEAFLADVELEIGGQRIDKIYSTWMRVYDELFRSGDEKEGYRRLVDFVDKEGIGTVKRFYVPLIFFFNKNVGLALPLIALQYHEIKLHINVASSVDGVDSTVDPKATLYVDYVYLDTDERRRFAQSSHEYLVEQLQFTGDEAASIDTNGKKSTNYRLNFNHPTKYLTFVVKGAKHGQFTAAPTDSANIGTYAEALAPIASLKLQLNGHDRFSERRGSYFNLVQPYQTLKAMPRAGVYLYSFCLKPDEHQPSGACNFSRIDNATLQVTYKKANVNSQLVSAIPDEDCTSANAATNLTALCVYAVNYNVLRVMSGMGGLAYSN